MPFVKSFDARYQGKEQLVEELDLLKEVMTVFRDPILAENKISDLIEYYQNRDVLVGYSYNEEEMGEESASDGEREIEARIAEAERQALERAENQYA